MLTLPQTIEQDGTEDRRELDRLLAGVAAATRDALAGCTASPARRCMAWPCPM